MLKKFYALAVLIAAVFCWRILPAEAADWSAYNYNTANNNYISDPLVLSSRVSEPKYIELDFNIPEEVVAEHTLFISDGNAASSLFAYDVDTMQLKWSRSHPKQILGLAYENGRLFYGAGPILYAVNPQTGDDYWSQTMPENWNIKVFHASRGKIYGDKWFSNIRSLIVIDQMDGHIEFQGGALADYVNDITLSDARIFVTASRYFGGGARIYAYDRYSYESIGYTVKCRSSSASSLYDQEENIIYLTAGNAALSAYYGDTLEALFQDKLYNLSRLVKYGNRLYAFSPTGLYSFNAKDRSASVSIINNLISSSERFTGQPIIVNGVLYTTVNSGKLFARNLETMENKIFDIDTSDSSSGVIYGDGKFIITSSYGAKKRIHVYNYANLGWPARSAGLSVMSPYNTAGMNQYLGQTHAHTEIERQLEFSKIIKFPPSVWHVETRY